MQTFIVDSFTDKPFRGNPAGVCLVDAEVEDQFMQQVAAELGFSETAFLFATGSATSWQIRYFSPKEEIPLCGHATLAAAKAVFHLDNDCAEAAFATRSGEHLVVRRVGERLEMTFPEYGLDEAEVPGGMAEALGLSSVQDCRYNRETNLLMLVAESRNAVESLAPNFVDLVKTHSTIAGVLVTARCEASDEHDFCSRFFWPWSGTDEDPVTGATHTFMGPYWASKIGKWNLRSLQCSKRSGELEIEVVNDAGQVRISGHAVLMLEGVWLGGK